MALTDTQCRTAKPKAKPYKMFDGEGLYLEVTPSGGKYWRQKYRIHGKEKRISYGAYPEISLQEARQSRLQVKQTIREGSDPVLIRLEKQQTAALAQADTFEKVAIEWYSKQLALWTARYAQSVMFRLKNTLSQKLAIIPYPE